METTRQDVAKGSQGGSRSCLITGCNKPAIIHVKWSSDSIRCEADLCQTHSDELWDMLNPLVKTNRMWVEYGPPNGIERNEIIEPTSQGDRGSHDSGQRAAKG